MFVCGKSRVTEKTLWTESKVEEESKEWVSLDFVIVVGVKRLALSAGGNRFGGFRGFPGFVFPMQDECSQNADDVHVKVHRPKGGEEREQRKFKNLHSAE